MQPNRTKSTLINTLFAIISRFATMIFGFVQKTVFIRVLGISYAGVSGLFTDILTVLSLAELGIGSAIAYSLYKPIAENDYKRIAQLMNFFKKAYWLIAGVIMAIGIALLPFIDYLVTDVPDIVEDIRLIFFLYIVNTAATYLLVYKNTLLVAAQKQYVVSNIQTIFAVVSTTAQCVVLLAFRNFIAFLLLQIVCSFLQNVTINYVAGKKYPQLKEYRNEKIPKEDKKALFKDIRALLMYKISNVILTGTDSTIISTSLGTGQVGILGNYRTIRGYVTSIIAQFYNSINPSLGNLAATAGPEEQFALFKKLNFGTFWLACFCGTSFFCLFNPFISLWLGNDEWLLPMVTVGVYVLEYYLSTMIGPVGAFRTANGLFVQTKYIALIKAILNLIISVLLVKPMGILGVLLGTVLSDVLTQVWYEPVVLYREVFKKSAAHYFGTFVMYLGITVVAAAIVSALSLLLPPMNAVLAFLIQIVFCVIVPNGLIVLLFHRTPEFEACIILIKKIVSSGASKIFRRK